MLCFLSIASPSSSILTQTKKMIGVGNITSSPSKIILKAFPARIFCFGSEIFPSGHQKSFRLKFLRLDSAHSNTLKPIPIRSSSNDISQVNIEAAETEVLAKPPTNTVRVRFQLRKECGFGEQFFILGDDSLFGGLWDPENALPLNWSDGHVWTVDLDLPVGRLVEFKFILKASPGEILWQPGPNRAIQTWETNKTIRLCEDWENADLQMMIEEDFVPISQQVSQSSFAYSDMPIVPDNMAHPRESVRLSTTGISLDGAKEKDVLGTVQHNSSEVVVMNVGYISDNSDENLSSNSQTEENMGTSNGALTARGVREENAAKEAMFTEEQGPVLVPGLIPLLDLENEEVSGPIIPYVSEEAINEGKAELFPEVGKKKETKREKNEKEKVKGISLFEKPEREAVEGVEKEHYNEIEEEMQVETELLETPNVLLEKDIQWGRRTLHKLLSNFGLF